MPVEDYLPTIGRTPEERARAAKTLDHVAELLRRSDGKGIFTPSFPPADTPEQGKVDRLMKQ
ncbi:MAG: hypothetical protein WC840_04395 [Candidatus Peribacteraceae bacterium]